MAKVVIVSADVAMPGEKGLSRVYYIAERFARAGYDTELIVSDFQHWQKAYRTAQEQREAIKAAPFRLTFLHGLAYKRNIEPRRIAGYLQLGRRLASYLAGREYDLLYCLIPDNYLAYRAVRVFEDRGLPRAVDVEDLWPEAMRLVLDIPVLSDLLLYPFAYYAKKVYRSADAVVGSSDTYRDEPLKYGVKPPRAVTVYVGTDLADFDRGAGEAAPRAQQKQPGEFWVTYAGTLGASYDIFTLIEAARLLRERGDPVTVQLLGDGPMRAEFEAAAAKTGADVRFQGFLPHDDMAAYLRRSDVAVNSLVRKAAQSIVSKIGDYLAAGIPMINTGLDPEFRKKTETDGFGVNVPPEDPKALADAIAALKRYPALAAEMGARARAVCEAQFDREKTSTGLLDLADALLHGPRGNGSK